MLLRWLWLLLRLRLIRRLSSGSCSRCTGGQWLLLLLGDLLLLDLLLLSDLRVQRDLGSLAVESDFGLFKIPAGICKESD